MAKFITLISWTDQGIRGFRDTAKRADDAAALAERMGGTFESIWWTLGPHDAVALADFPDDETGTAFLLAVGSLGNVRTTTMRAFTREEMEGIIAKAG
jgi:uncharacterized protein with GYD domain